MKRMQSKFTALFSDPKAPTFLIVILGFGIASGLFAGALNNYLHEILYITKIERGIVEFPRELPGLLLVILIAMLFRICETRILRLAILISLAGMVGLSLLGEHRWMAIGMIVLWSTGEHLMMPLRQSIGVHMARPENAGLALGTVRSMRNMGQLVGFYLIPLVFLLIPVSVTIQGSFAYFRIVFIIAIMCLLGSLAFAYTLPKRDRHVRRERFYFRKKYWKYYILEVFFGARKQVFITFAPYVLILQYGTRTEIMALLYGILSTINIFAAPIVGKLIDRLGYRIIIIADTLILIVLCLMYGFTHRIFPQGAAYIIVCIVFIVDSVLFVATMARTMYVKQISTSQDEVTSTLSTGISINHLISIGIAIMGGFLWARLGIEVLFSVAAFFGLGSFLFSLTLPKQKIEHHF